jgi:predicted permease
MSAGLRKQDRRSIDVAGVAMQTFWQDVRYGSRLLARSPGFTAVAVITLALGIGANSALFSVVNGVLLNPLPFPAPDRLVAIYTRTTTFSEASVSYPNFLDWERDTRTFASMAAFRSDDFNLTGAGEAERLEGFMISAGLFPMLGVRPVLGRTFLPEEDRQGAGPVALLGEGLWKRRFGASPEIVGRSLTLNGKAYTVVGVIPAAPAIRMEADVYVPIGQWAEPAFRDRRIGMGTGVIGRLKPGMRLEAAQADADRVARALEAAYPEADKGSGIALVPLKRDVVGSVRGILLMLLGAVGFVLLIACANVANLLLARSTGRTREFAIRSALGANAGRVVRQLLTESVILSMAGGGLGLILARWGTRAILAALPDTLPRSGEIGLDARVLLFTLGISFATGILFGLAPALRLLEPGLQESLKEGGRGTSGPRHRVQSAFVAAEMGMSLVLLVGAGLMIRTLAALWALDPGFDPKGVLAFNLSFGGAADLSGPQMRARFREALHHFEGVPGVAKVSLQGGSLPMTGDSEVPFWRDDQPKPASQNEMPMALFYLVNSAYAPAMRIPLIRGRFLSDSDDERSRAVAVIDEAFARRYFPNEDPVGRRIHIELLDLQPEIVGVVGHVEHWGLGNSEHQNLQAELYLPIFQLPDRFWPLLASGCGFVARTEGPPLGAVAGLRRAAAQFDRNAVAFEPRAMESIVAHSIARQRMAMLLLGVFASLALVLSAIGVYGVIAYLAGQRTHEIGLRIALGATRRDVLGLVLGQGMRIALAGIGAGILAALGLTRLLAGMIYGVGTADPVTFGGVSFLLGFVAFVACYIPARRAMATDPMTALRRE